MFVTTTGIRELNLAMMLVEEEDHATMGWILAIRYPYRRPWVGYWPSGILIEDLSRISKTCSFLFDKDNKGKIKSSDSSEAKNNS